MMLTAYLPDRIFTGTEWLYDHALLLDTDQVIELVPRQQIQQAIPVKQFPGFFIAPAFVDLQVYGAAGQLFSLTQDTAALVALRDAYITSGTAFCLPTLATNTMAVFYACIDAVRKYWDEGGEGIPGLHLEGPWINPIKRGAHIESLIHPPTIDEVKALLDYGRGVIRMVTLAPECCTTEIIDLLLHEGIVVSAGHSNAQYEEAIKAFDNGIATVTHLFNAMSGLQHRAPGLVGAAFDHPNVKASIIADGYHVDFAAVRIAKKIMGDRLFAITDAVTTTSAGPYQHQRSGDKYEANNVLSGSALTMAKAVLNLVNFAGIELGEALRMCSLYPAQLIGLKHEGHIEPGGRAKLVLMSETGEVCRSWN